RPVIHGQKLTLLQYSYPVHGSLPSAYCANVLLEKAVISFTPPSMSSREATALWEWGYRVTTTMPPVFTPMPERFMLEASVPPLSITSRWYLICSFSQQSSMAATIFSSQTTDGSQILMPMPPPTALLPSRSQG